MPDIACQVLSQSLINRRELQEEDAAVSFQTGSLAILMRVSSRVSLPEGVKFQDVVAETFLTYATDFQQQLSEVTDYFEPPTPRRSADVPGGLQAPIQNDESKELPLIAIISAAVGGAVLAALLALLLVRGMQYEDESVSDDILEDDSFVFVVSKKELKTTSELSVSTMGPVLPPTPLGVDEIPGVIGPDSYLDLEEGLSPTSEFQDVMTPLGISSPRDAGFYSKDSDPMGLRMSVADVERTVSMRSKRTSSNPTRSLSSAPSVSTNMSRPVSILKKTSTILPELISDDSSNESDNDTRPTKDSDESSSLKGLVLVGTATPALSMSESHSVREEKQPKQQSRPLTSPRRRIFGFGGIRNKYTDKDRFQNMYQGQDRFLEGVSESGDVSIDPMRAAGTPKERSKHRQSKFEECEVRSPVGRFLRKSETPSGSKFLQMNVTSAVHTGDVLDDLGQLETDMDGHLESKASATAETPRQANTSQYRRAPKRIIYRDY